MLKNEIIPLYVHRFCDYVQQYQTPLGKLAAVIDNLNETVEIRIESRGVMKPRWDYQSRKVLTFYELYSLAIGAEEFAYMVVSDMLHEIVRECMKKGVEDG